MKIPIREFISKKFWLKSRKDLDFPTIYAILYFIQAFTTKILQCAILQKEGNCLLKSVLYWVLLLTTVLRFADLFYLLTTDSTNLPIPVLVITAAVVLYGLYLVMKKFTGGVRLKQLVSFFIFETGAFVFNIIYVAVSCPLQIGMADTMAVGTFLDILINCCILFFSLRQMRGGYALMARSIGHNA